MRQVRLSPYHCHASCRLPPLHPIPLGTSLKIMLLKFVFKTKREGV